MECDPGGRFQGGGGGGGRFCGTTFHTKTSNFLYHSCNPYLNW